MYSVCVLVHTSWYSDLIHYFSSGITHGGTVPICVPGNKHGSIADKGRCPALWNVLLLKFAFFWSYIILYYPCNNSHKRVFPLNKTSINCHWLAFLWGWGGKTPPWLRLGVGVQCGTWKWELWGGSWEESVGLGTGSFYSWLQFALSYFYRTQLYFLDSLSFFLAYLLVPGPQSDLT